MQSFDSNDWMISIPLSALESLKALPGQMAVLQHDNERLKREVTAMRSQFLEVMEKLRELQKNGSSKHGR